MTALLNRGGRRYRLTFEDGAFAAEE